MSCFLCFSKDNLTPEEAQGKYGEAYAPFLQNNNKYDITMCQAPCKETLCWLGAMACFCPAQVLMRKKALNHVDPGSGWSNYKCCQGYFGGCCCLQPGSMGESTCPVPCMCLEACICPGPAVSATSNVIRERYQLGLDEDDVRLIRCSNCLFMCSLCLSIVSCFTPCEGDDAVARGVTLVSDIVFCCASGCMTAQVNREINLRGKENDTPELAEMER